MQPNTSRSASLRSAAQGEALSPTRRVKKSSRTALAVATLGSLSLLSIPARAGGFALGENGTEALGRGGAFVAKADSPLALEYNVAGLAQARGTRVLFDNHLFFSQYRFARAGSDGSGPYPEIGDHAGQPFWAPWFGFSTDFGYFRRWTFALGAFGPSSVGKRNYGLYSPTEGNPRRPGPGRYDVVATDLLIVQPTLAIAVRAHRVLDLGISGQLVAAQFNLSSATYAPQDLGGTYPKSAACATQTEVPDCDAFTRVQVQSWDNFALQLGALLHPGGGFHIGAHVRTAVNLGTAPINAKGTVSASEPVSIAGFGVGADRMDARFQARLPWIARLGLRYAFSKAGREIADIEVDGVYESWGQMQGSDNQLTLVNPPVLVNGGMPIDIRLVHNYRDTFGLRVGGAWRQPLGQSAAATLRLGAYYDTSATAPADTRIDFDTLSKIGGTIGLGLSLRGVTLNLAYAYLYSLPRTVTDGALLPIDGLTGKPLAVAGMQAPAINNGEYQGQNHILSLGLSIVFDELVRGPDWLSRRGL